MPTCWAGPRSQERPLASSLTPVLPWPAGTQPYCPPTPPARPCFAFSTWQSGMGLDIGMAMVQTLAAGRCLPCDMGKLLQGLG